MAGEGGCLCQWELKAPTDRSRSDCVHEQVAKRIANVRFTCQFGISSYRRELEKFILEMGSDFAFLARQKHFVLDGKDYYMDLLFYHRGLRRLVLVELKLGEFEPQDKGQVELYLRWLEKNERVEGEESPVALILCAEKSQETIELMQLDHGNIHVGQYMTQMPPKELLEQKLSLAIANARELLEQRKEE